MSDDPPSAQNPYAAVIADLEARRDQLDATIANLKAVMGQGSAVAMVDRLAVATQGPTEPPAAVGPGFFHGLSIPEAAKKLLAVRKRDLTNAEIGAAFKAGGLALNSVNVPNTINSVLSRRFAKVGDIVKVSRGMWGLKEWHPHVRARKTNGDEDVELLEEMLAEEDEDE